MSDSRRRRRNSSNSGFTLVELMVVIVIIGVLASAVTFSVRGYLITSKQNVARMDISKITAALEMFYTLHDRFPSNEEGLAALSKPSDRMPDGILSKLPKDPWGAAYQYNCPGRSRPYEVMTFGADRREGGTGGDLDLSSADTDPVASHGP